MERWSAGLTLLGMPLMFALPFGVKLTALGIDEGVHSSRLGIGLILLAAGILGVECTQRYIALVQKEPGRLGIRPDRAGLVLRVTRALQTSSLILLLQITVLKFALMLDGHVHLRACGWLLLVYATGAILVWAGRKGRTRWGSCYLRWGWAPIVAFGVPLALPALRAAGLVPLRAVSF